MIPQEWEEMGTTIIIPTYLYHKIGGRLPFPCIFCPVNGKRGFVQRLVVITPVSRSGMACVLKESHSFTCTPRVHPLTE